LAATWRWPTLAQMNHSELSHMAGAVDDSTINIVEVIIIIIAVSFQNTFTAVYSLWKTSCLLFVASVFSAYGFVLVGRK